MRRLLTDFPDDPIFNMKAVEQQTDIPAATLRAWERRYGLIEPKRTVSGYRLYSERDIAVLHLVRAHMSAGLTISRVVAMLQSMRESNEPIWIGTDDGAPPMGQDAAMPPTELVLALYDAVVNLDSNRADQVLDKAFAIYTLPTVYVEVIAATLVEIGEAWLQGKIFISTEHFATNYLHGRLLTLLHSYRYRLDMPKIFVGCAPNERHDVGALIFAIMMRQQGYNVIYLGQDVPIEDLIATAQRERPLIVCISANSNSAALGLREMQAKLLKIDAPSPMFGYGGRAFDLNPDLRKQVPGHYLEADPREALNIINTLLWTHSAIAKAH